ncbi:MAG TPA: carbamate kinase, partial [Thermoanaerobaculia bacterium]|nr:carbamate kinase [Thermoanaerobaculia bacterium]
MAPKIDASARFVEAGGRQVLITRAESLSQALEGKTGTLIRESDDRVIMRSSPNLDLRLPP